MPTHRRHIQTNAPASVFQSHMAINKDGWVLFFFLFLFFPGNETPFLFNCTKFTLRRVRTTIQSLGDLGLWGLNASSEQRLRCCGPEPACLAKHSPQVGNVQMVLVSRWAAGEHGGPALSTCALPPEAKGCLAHLPDLQLTPHQSSQLKLCFPCGPTKQWGWGDFAALSLFGSSHRVRAVGATTAKRAHRPIQERERQWCAFYLAFSMPSALQQQAIK